MYFKMILLLTAFAFFFNNCESGAKEKKDSVSTTTENETFDYNLKKPAATWTLPDDLLEISGNAYIDDKHLLVIEDTHPLLYVVRLDDKAVIEKTIPFAPAENRKFDIEDVAIQGKTAYALWSHGTVYKIDDWQTNPNVSSWETGLDKQNNTEGLSFDPRTHKLLIACKNNSGDETEKKSTRAIYAFDPATGKMDNDPFLLIERKDFEKLADGKFNFYPSAVAVHPVTGDVFMLSTKDTKGLAHYGRNGKLKSFQWIDKEVMPQPEGMCFSPTGTLYISTEGKHGQPAKILRFDIVK